MTVECPRINQESAGSDNPPIANSLELRQKKPGIGGKKKPGRFEKWEMRKKKKLDNFRFGKIWEKETGKW